MPPLCWKPAPQVLLGASRQQPSQGLSVNQWLLLNTAGLPWAGLVAYSHPPARVQGAGTARFVWLSLCLSFLPAHHALGSSAGASPARAVAHASLGVAAVQAVCRSGPIPGVAPVEGLRLGPVQPRTAVFSSPDTSIQNMHLMTEARPSVESRCKWYSSWKYRWVPPQPRRARVYKAVCFPPLCFLSRLLSAGGAVSEVGDRSDISSHPKGLF